jgi:hypothetical protein
VVTGVLDVVTLFGFGVAVVVLWRRSWPLFWLVGIIAYASQDAANILSREWGWLAVSASVTALNCAGLVNENRRRGRAARAADANEARQ